MSTSQEPIVRDLYIGTGAFLGRVDSESTCGFWPTDPLGLPTQFDKAALVEVNLAMTAEAAAAGKIPWADVQTESGKLTFGPTWPPGKSVGRVYIREDRAKGVIPNPPLGSSGEDYEFMLLIYRTGTQDPRAGLRYQGVKAEILQTNGDLTEVYLYGPGQSKNQQRKRAWIDLKSVDVCEPPTGRNIAEVTDVQPGALFIKDDISLSSWPSWPKLPPGMGL